MVNEEVVVGSQKPRNSMKQVSHCVNCILDVQQIYFKLKNGFKMKHFSNIHSFDYFYLSIVKGGYHSPLEC